MAMLKRMKISIVCVLMLLIHAKLVLADFRLVNDQDRLIEFAFGEKVDCSNYKASGDEVEQMRAQPLKYSTYASNEKLYGKDPRPKGFYDFEVIALAAYTLMDFEEINSSLRDLAAGMISPYDFRYSGWVKSICSALNKISVFKGTVFRGARLSPEMIHFYESAVGNKIIMNGFTSTSSSEIE